LHPWFWTGWGIEIEFNFNSKCGICFPLFCLTNPAKDVNDQSVNHFDVVSLVDYLNVWWEKLSKLILDIFKHEFAGLNVFEGFFFY
jgi:hypothetical protein